MPGHLSKCLPSTNHQLVSTWDRYPIRAGSESSMRNSSYTSRGGELHSQIQNHTQISCVNCSGTWQCDQLTTISHSRQISNPAAKQALSGIFTDPNPPPYHWIHVQSPYHCGGVMGGIASPRPIMGPLPATAIWAPNAHLASKRQCARLGP